MEVDDLMPLSALQHLIYCERQFALIHVEQAWADNALTVSGRLLHERADLPGQTVGPTRRVARALPLRSDRLGLSGKADVVEFHREGPSTSDPPWRPFPVEYKHGRPKPHQADEVQLCAQAICLEEMLGLDVPAGALFYGKTRRRKPVTFTPALRDHVARAAARCHELMANGRTPPAVHDRRCDRCSLINLCLPSATTASPRPTFAAISIDMLPFATFRDDAP